MRPQFNHITWRVSYDAVQGELEPHYLHPRLPALLYRGDGAFHGLQTQRVASAFGVQEEVLHVHDDEGALVGINCEGGFLIITFGRGHGEASLRSPANVEGVCGPVEGPAVLGAKLYIVLGHCVDV